jgi:hypothetical protein
MLRNPLITTYLKMGRGPKEFRRFQGSDLSIRGICTLFQGLSKSAYGE